MRCTNINSLNSTLTLTRVDIRGLYKHFPEIESGGELLIRLGP